MDSAALGINSRNNSAIQKNQSPCRRIAGALSALGHFRRISKSRNLSAERMNSETAAAINGITVNFLKRIFV